MLNQSKLYLGRHICLPIMWYVKGKDYLCKEQLEFFFFWLQSFLALINWSGKICSMP